MVNNKAMISLSAVMSILLAVATASARDRQMLDTAVNKSIHERSNAESRYRDNDKAAREDAFSEANSPEPHAIRVEIGDELAASAPPVSMKNEDRALRERHVSKKLDNEWKEVNRSYENTAAQIEKKTTISGGGSSASIPSSRSQKSARAGNGDG